MAKKRKQVIRVRQQLVALATVGMLALALPTAAADTQIVAGKRIGEVSLGAPRAQVEKQLGKAQTERAPSPQRTLAIWPLPGTGNLHVEFVDGKVARVGTNAKEYATADGIAIGASIADVRARHAQLAETEYTVQRKGGKGKAGVTAQCYDDVANGIGFEFDRGAGKGDFTLAAIYVHAAGKPSPCGREDDPRATKKIGASP